ncbi:MAG: hypothetical protein ABEH80_01470, partial [Halobaculum sp.]
MNEEDDSVTRDGSIGDETDTSEAETTDADTLHAGEAETADADTLHAGEVETADADTLHAGVTAFLREADAVYDEYEQGYLDPDAALARLDSALSDLRDA